MGSLPPETADFYFSNSTKTRLWDILTSVYNQSETVCKNSNTKSESEKMELLKSLNLGINDIILDYDRTDYNSVSDNDIIPMKYSNLVDNIRNVQVDKLLFVYQSAAAWFLHSLENSEPVPSSKLNTKIEYGTFKELSIKGRNVKCILLPNPLNRGKKGETLDFKLQQYKKEIRDFKTVNYIDEIFNRLDNWRHLPSYQLERRFDIFFSLYLNSILNHKYKTSISGLIPEFPIRVGYLKKSHKRPNKSIKIDYLAISIKDKRLFFVELKTDNGSIRHEQMENMIKAKEMGISKILKGIIKVHTEAAKTYSKYKIKHLALLQEFVRLGLLSQKEEEFIPTKHDYKISLVLIEPQKSIQSIIDCDIILFEEIIPIINKRKDEFSQRLVQSLRLWKDNPVM
ncbi:MAG: hypothetical protein R2764_22810 [Bacteroidales bacterium]